MHAWHDPTSAPGDLDPHRAVLVACATGPRAATAAGLLRRHGFADVIHVAEGGTTTWSSLGLPVEGGPPALEPSAP